MRTYLSGVVVLLVLASAGPASGKDRKDPADAVRAADQAWMQVFSAKNVDKSVAFFDENGASLSPNSPIVTGREAIRMSYVAFFGLPNLKISWHADRVDVAKSNDLAYTSGGYDMTFTDPSGKPAADKGKYVTVWKKQSDGSWKVMLDIFNSDLPPAGR